LFSLFKRLFGDKPQSAFVPESPPSSKKLEFLVVDQGEEIPRNKWYRMSHWQIEHFLKMETDWDRDWKCFEREEKVVGVTHEERDIKFLQLYNQPGFKIFLEEDPLNEYDSNAVKVMASAKIGGKKVVEQLGFLSKQTAQQLKDEEELDARPYSVYLPVQGYKYGLCISVLIRSKQYRDKVYGKSERPMPKKVAWEPPPWTGEDDENLEPVYDLLADKDFRDDYSIKKPSKTLIKQAIKMLHNEGLPSAQAFDEIDRVVEKLVEIKPELEIEC